MRPNDGPLIFAQRYDSFEQRLKQIRASNGKAQNEALCGPQGSSPIIVPGPISPNISALKRCRLRRAASGHSSGRPSAHRGIDRANEARRCENYHGPKPYFDLKRHPNSIGARQTGAQVVVPDALRRRGKKRSPTISSLFRLRHRQAQERRVDEDSLGEYSMEIFFRFSSSCLFLASLILTAFIPIWECMLLERGVIFRGPRSRADRCARGAQPWAIICRDGSARSRLLTGSASASRFSGAPPFLPFARTRRGHIPQEAFHRHRFNAVASAMAILLLNEQGPPAKPSISRTCSFGNISLPSSRPEVIKNPLCLYSGVGLFHFIFFAKNSCSSP